MTTLEVGISGPPHGGIDLSKGVYGAATLVFLGAAEAVTEGRATGTAGASGCGVRMKGSVLADLLGPGRTGLYERYSSSSDQVADLHCFP